MALNMEKVAQVQNLVVNSGQDTGLKIWVNENPDKGVPNTKIPIRNDDLDYVGDLKVLKRCINPQSLQGATIVVTPPAPGSKGEKWAPKQAAVGGGKYLITSFPSFLTINGIPGEEFADQNPATSQQGGGPGGAAAPVAGGSPFPPRSQGAVAPQSLDEYRGAMAEAFTYYQVKVLASAKVNVSEILLSDPYVIAQLLEIAAKFTVSERIAQDHGKVERPESLPDIPF